MTSSTYLLLGIATTGIMGIGGYQIIQGDMTFGDFLVYLLPGFYDRPHRADEQHRQPADRGFAGLDRTEEIMNMARR